MEDNKINGFDPDELAHLYRFLKFYEDKYLKRLNNEGDLFLEMPFMRDLKVFLSQKGLRYQEKRSRELRQIQIDNLSNELYYTERDSVFIGFLYHLRNSIAHALTTKNSNFIELKDYSDELRQSISAKGKVSYSIIKEFIDLLIKYSNENV